MNEVFGHTIVPTEYQIDKCKKNLKTELEKSMDGWKAKSMTEALRITILRIFLAKSIDTSNIESLHIKICSGFDSAGSFKLRNGRKFSSTHIMFAGFCIASITDQNGCRIYVETSQGPIRYGFT